MRDFDADAMIARDRLAALAIENGVDPMHVTDAPERTAEALWHLLSDGEDRRWLYDTFGPFEDSEQ
jgi:hypothetical protein